MEKPKSLPGKTFCLFGKSDNTNGYYAKIAFLIDELVMKCADERELLSLLQCLSRKRRNLLSLIHI